MQIGRRGSKPTNKTSKQSVCCVRQRQRITMETWRRRRRQRGDASFIRGTMRFLRTASRHSWRWCSAWSHTFTVFVLCSFMLVTCVVLPVAIVGRAGIIPTADDDDDIPSTCSEPCGLYGEQCKSLSSCIQSRSSAVWCADKCAQVFGKLGTEQRDKFQQTTRTNGATNWIYSGATQHTGEGLGVIEYCDIIRPGSRFNLVYEFIP